MRRRVLLIFGLVAAVATVPAPAMAHGIGGREDLPVPLGFFIVGAGLAIVISFVMLSVRWPEARLQDGPRNRLIRSRALGWFYRALGVVGLAGFALVLLGGLIDGSASRNNIAPVLVWVYFWLVVPFAGVVLGDLWRWMTPWRTISSWVNHDRAERPELLDEVGQWPAVVAFVGFTWLELVSPDSSFPRTLAIAAIVYTLYHVALSYWAGPTTGAEIGGAFIHYNRLFGAIAPVSAGRLPGRSVGAATTVEEHGVVIRRGGWLRSLPGLRIRPGFTAFVLAMIGTVTYDGMSSTGWWGDVWGTTARETWFGTSALVGTVVAVGIGYYAASWASVKIAADGRRVSDVANTFAHTLVPIAFAYAFAHYFTLIVFEGQQLARMASDPFGLGWDLFGTADWAIVFSTSTLWIWYVQLGAIVLGHIGGVVLAHDRALAEFDESVAVRTQYAMLILMVALTSLGLFILAG